MAAVVDKEKLKYWILVFEFSEILAWIPHFFKVYWIFVNFRVSVFRVHSPSTIVLAYSSQLSVLVCVWRVHVTVRLVVDTIGCGNLEVPVDAPMPDWGDAPMPDWGPMVAPVPDLWPMGALVPDGAPWVPQYPICGPIRALRAPEKTGVWNNWGECGCK